MDSFVVHVQRVLVAQSWQIALLTLSIAAVAYLLRHRSAHIRYLLWLIVLAKCLVPPIYTVPLRVLPQEPSVQGRIGLVLPEPETVTPERTLPDAAALDSVTTRPIEPTATGTVPAPPIPSSETWLDGLERMGVQHWCVVIWASGITLYLLANLLRVVRTNRLLSRQRKPIPPAVHTEIADLLSVYGLKQLPRIWLVENIGQPFVWGICRGSVYLPNDFLSIRNADHKRDILAHEFSHILRLDAAVNLLQILAQAVYWFHPFVWWTNRMIRIEREKCCDEMAIARLRTQAKTYSAALVDTVVRIHGSQRPAPSLAIVGPVKTIEERMRTMLRPGKRFYAHPSLVVVLMIALTTIMTTPTTIVLTARAAVVEPLDTEERSDNLGRLEYIDHWSSDEYLARCTSVEISLDGRHLYTAAYGSRSVAVLGRDELTGYIKRLTTVPLKGVFVARISPDGRYVICSDVLGGPQYYAGSNSVSLFERDQATGQLALLDSAKNGEKDIDTLDYVVDVDFSPDSQFVYVVAQRSAAVTAFRITDQKKLALIQSDRGQDQCFDGARGITVSPDGQYLYVASSQAGTLAVLQRNTETGELELSQVIRSDQEGISGLAGVWDVTCSLDGRFIYANAGGELGAICMFERKNDGSLSFVHGVYGNTDQVGLGGGARLCVSPDGKHLYALGNTSNSIAVYQRHDETGRLTPLQTHSFQGIGRYCFPADLAISLDGGYVYVCGEGIHLNGIIALRRLTGTTAGPAYALYEATRTGDSERLQSLLEGDVDINVRGERGYTALHWTAQENQGRAATVLLDEGADINARTGESGWTPLHIAALQSNKDVSKVLIARDADLAAENRNNRYTPLVITQQTGDMDFAAFLLDEGVPLDTTDKWGWTPLHRAAIRGDIASAALLLERSADVNVKDSLGHVPLFYAIRVRDMKMIERLISKGADVNVKDQHGKTLLDFANRMNNTAAVELLKKHGATETLHGAAASGDIDEVKRLLSEGHDVNSRDSEGQTPLHLAANLGNAEIVEILISNGADIEARDGRWHNTALLNTSVRGRKEVVELLLEKGANIEAKDGNGLTPLNLTAAYSNREDYLDIVKLLLEKGADIEARGYIDCTPLQAVVAVGRKEAAEFLKAHGAKVNAVGSEYFGTAAHQAMRWNQRDMVRWSLSNGIDIPSTHQAAYLGETERLRSLLSAEAGVNEKDIAEYTPLHCAVFGGNKETVRLLIENRADIKARTAANETPLFLACHRGDLNMVRLLVDNGAEVDDGAYRKLTWGSEIDDNWSNLHMAAHRGHSDVVEYLLDQRADIHARCCARRVGEETTPLHLAARAGHAETVQHLLAKGADIDAKTGRGDTPMSLARKNQHPEVVDLLRKHGAKE